MSKIQKLELTWVGKNEQEEIEPRILVENPELSHVYNTSKNGQMTFCDKDGDFDNMLIHGDNLLALKALEQDFAGQVKCIYIDPPYNTGSAFEHYDDNLEHSIWLNLMRSRLEILKNLLKENGLIYIQIDDNEQAYLKVLCDEIFGRDNFVNCIAIKMSPSSGLKRSHQDKGYIKNKEYILVYSKGSVQIKSLYDEWKKYDNHYSIYFDNNDYYSLLDILKKEFPQHKGLNSNQYLLFDDVKQFIVNNADKIYRTHDASRWSLDNVDNGELLYENDNFCIKKVFNPANNNEFELLKSKKSKSAYDRLEPLSWNIIDGKIQTLRGDLWLDFEKDMGNVSKEGNVKFPASKKPERLIYDILYSSTEEGDIVLDSFLGSGTTCAVAHKMKRKWIGIEMGEHAYTLSKVRIDAVVDGEQSGISKAVNWQGGGSYKFYELAPSLVIKDSHGREIINPEYNANMLAAAMAKHEGFKYSPDKENVYKQGFASEKSFIFTTTTHLTAEYLDEIAEHFTDEEFLVINCKSFDGNISNNYKNIKIKKIPQSILGKCVFGKDNYNLNIINLPTEEGADEEN